MKKKRICAWLWSVAVFLGANMPIAAKSQKSSGEALEMKPLEGLGLNSFSSSAERLSAMEHIKSSGGTELYVDILNGDIAVVDTESGSSWFSSPINISGDSVASESIKQHMASQVRLSLLDASNAEVELLSYRDCIQSGQCEIYKTDEGLTFSMTLGREEQRRLAPEAIPASSMEEYILPDLEGRALTKIKYFYKKYDAEKMSERQLENISEKYPLVSEEPIYVLKSVTDTEAEEIESYIKETDYTFELMEKDLKLLGAEISENASAYVKLKINYNLDENGELFASIDCGEIEYNSESFVLNKIYLLEYFASADAGDKSGFIILPDGSGAVMNFNSRRLKANTELTLDIYGRDMALSYSNQAVTNEDTVLPAYGVSASKGSILGFIENGAERASIKASSGGTNTSLAAVSSALTFCDVDRFDYTEIGSASTCVISDKSGFSGEYSVRYKLLPKNSSYSEIAVACRDMMVREKYLKKSGEAESSTLNVGLYGAVDYLDRVLFMPVNRLIPLTDTEDIRSIAEDLTSDGVDSLDLRYIGWSSGGLKNSAAKGDVLSVLGSKKDMQELAGYLSDLNIGFYPDLNLQTVYKNTLFDGFTPSKNAVRMLNRQYANYYDMDMATNGQDNSVQRYLLNLQRVTALYERSMKKFKNYDSYGISLSGIGSLLYSDKNNKNAYGREAALEGNMQIIANAAENYSVMLEGGNSYTWSYADKIIGLPSSAGGFAQTDYSVPFVQSVLHGYIPYTATAINISGNPQEEFLKAAETGSQLYFELTAQNGEKLKTTDFSFAYSTDYGNWSQSVKEYYEKWNAVFAELSRETIENHYYPTEDVSVTVYSNGTEVIVNFGDETFTYKETQIPAKDFISIEQR